MTDRLLKLIGEKYSLAPKDAGEFKTIKANGMRFEVSAFEAEGLGHVSVMTAKGFLGLMRMDTLIINPTQRDLPLFSYDRIHAMGNDTLIIELYDTGVSEFSSGELDRLAEEAKRLPERDPGKHWYDDIRLKQSVSKKGKRGESKAFDELTEKYLKAYLEADCPKLQDFETKWQKSRAYVDGLLQNGGPSTDVFKKQLGEEKTAKLFGEVLFGTR